MLARRALLACAVAVVGACHDRYRVGGTVERSCGSAALALALPPEMTGDDVSHWAQPWRATIATRSAHLLRDAIGHGTFIGRQYDELVPALAAAGITRAKVFTHWANMDPAAVDRPQEPFAVDLAATLAALRAHGIRPSLTVSSVPNWPSPAREDLPMLAVAANGGDRTLRFAAADVARLTPGRTVVLGRTGSLDAAPLVTAVGPDGAATLSKPLRDPLAAGPTRTLTFAVAPFAHARQEDGSPNPAYVAALDAWLSYVAAMIDAARQALGEGAFDLDVAAPDTTFLDVNRFYEEPIDRTPGDANAARESVVAATLALLRREGVDRSGVVVVDGAHAASRAVGLGRADDLFGALSRSASMQTVRFDDDTGSVAGRPIDAQGSLAGAPDGQGAWRPAFTPRYFAFFPEQALTALAPRSLVWDMLERARAATGPEVRISSLSLGGGVPAARGVTTSAAQLARLRAKAALRGIVAYAGAGASAVYLFGPPGAGDSTFTTGQPGDETLAALARMAQRFGPRDAPATALRPLALASVAGCGDGLQFAGDGSARHPNLRDRDVVAAFPWLRADGRFVVAAYVMTRDLLRATPDVVPDDARRFDLPARRFTLTLTALRAGARGTAYDPLSDVEVPVTVRDGDDGATVVELDLVDSPRLIELDDS